MSEGSAANCGEKVDESCSRQAPNTAQSIEHILDCANVPHEFVRQDNGFGFPLTSLSSHASSPHMQK
jgi:hypothetical protein